MKTEKKVLCMVGVFFLITAGVFAGGGADKSGKIKIAYISKSLADQFQTDMRQGAMDAAKEFNIELSYQAPDKETDTERQVQLLENAIINKVNAIVLGPVHGTALNPTIVKANKAKIPVILVDSMIDEANLKGLGGYVESFVGIDNYNAAALAGEYVVKNFKGGKILLLEGTPGSENLQQRINGFMAPIKGKPGFEVIASLTANTDRNLAYNVMQDVLTRYPDVNLVWAICAETGQGAIRAIEEAKKTGISVFDFDNSADDIAAIKAGTLVGSVDQYPAIQARAAIQACMDVLAGKKLPSSVETQAQLVTKSNVK